MFGDDIVDTLTEFKAKAHKLFPYALLFKEPVAPSETTAAALVAAKEEATMTTSTTTATDETTDDTQA